MCNVIIDDKFYSFSNKFELDGISFKESSIPLFKLSTVHMERVKNVKVLEA